MRIMSTLVCFIVVSAQFALYVYNGVQTGEWLYPYLIWTSSAMVGGGVISAIVKWAVKPEYSLAWKTIMVYVVIGLTASVVLSYYVTPEVAIAVLVSCIATVVAYLLHYMSSLK